MKPEDLMYTAQEIGRAVIDWTSFNGFSGESCGSCKATANVLALGPGWFCPCGHYNAQSLSNTYVPHEFPKYGPPQQTILDGIKMVKYAFYSATSDASYGHVFYKIKGKETKVTLVSDSNAIGQVWPDTVFVGRILMSDYVRANSSWNFSVKKDTDWSFNFHDTYNKHKYRFDEIPLRSKIEEKKRITTVGDHRVTSSGYEIPDNRLVVTATWTDAGVKYVRTKTSAQFRRLYGDDAVPVYDEPGVVARWTAPQVPKGRYRWVGDKYRYENN